MSQNVPGNLKYTKDHEWAQIEGDVCTVGITDFAQSQLGDIVFMELPEPGRTVTLGESFGVVESIKSVSDLYSPVTGEILERNDDLAASPEGCNQNPYGSWMVKIKMTVAQEQNDLLSAENYLNLL